MIRRRHGVTDDRDRWRRWPVAALAVLALAAALFAPHAHVANAADPAPAGWPPLVIDPSQLPPPTPAELPPLRQLSGACFVAGFSGWRGVDDQRGDPLALIDQFESPADAKSFNDASAVAKLLRATQGSYNGDDPHIYRFYQWALKALPELRQAAANGQRIVLIGHGPGGSASLSIAQALQNEGIPVELMIEIDTFDGQARGLTPTAEAGLGVLIQRPTLAPPSVYLNTSPVPRNVLKALNYYQLQSSYYHGRPQFYSDRGGVFLNRELTLDAKGIAIQHDTADSYVAGLQEARDAIAAACVPPSPPSPPTARCGGPSLAPMCDVTPGIFPG